MRTTLQKSNTRRYQGTKTATITTEVTRRESSPGFLETHQDRSRAKWAQSMRTLQRREAPTLQTYQKREDEDKRDNETGHTSQRHGDENGKTREARGNGTRNPRSPGTRGNLKPGVMPMLNWEDWRNHAATNHVALVQVRGQWTADGH